MKDKGMAPPFREASEIGDGVNINVEADAQGRSVQIYVADENLSRKGEANHVSAFKEVVGPRNLLSGNSGSGFVNQNREVPETEDKGVD